MLEKFFKNNRKAPIRRLRRKMAESPAAGGPGRDGLPLPQYEDWHQRRKFEVLDKSKTGCNL